MCGIFLTEQENPANEMASLIRNRGPDFYNSVCMDGIVAISSVLSIRDHVSQPVSGDGYLLLYNGEIYNGVSSDTMFVKDAIDNALASRDDTPPDGREVVEDVYREVNRYENEFAIVIMMGSHVYFFKDDIGKRSLGYTLEPFSVSSVGYHNEIDQTSIYSYNVLTKELSGWRKESRIVDEYMSRISVVSRYLGTEKYSGRYGFLDQHRGTWDKTPPIQRHNATVDVSGRLEAVDKLGEILRDSLRKRLVPGNLCVFFSGGVDSMLLAVFLHYVADPGQRIYLVNTSFTPSHDRSAGQRGFEELCSKFRERCFVFVRNDVCVEDIRLFKKHICRLIHPKTGAMDFNIGATLFFTAREARKYSRVAYSGSGADELFGGYRRYRGEDLRNNMFFDLFTISAHNLCRDDRVVSDNQVECRLPFLDSEIVSYSLGLEDNMIVQGMENKFVIRELLRRCGFVDASRLPKKAMQYGSGISKIENTV